MLGVIVEGLGVVVKQSYYILVEEHGFHEVADDAELMEIVCDMLNNKRVLEMYTRDSDVPMVSRITYDASEDENDPDYECSHDGADESEDKLNSEDEWTGKDSDYDVEEDEVRVEKPNEVKEDNQIENVMAHCLIQPRNGKHKSTGEREQDVGERQFENKAENDKTDESENDLCRGNESDDDFGSLHGSEEDIGGVKPVFNPKDMYDPPLQCGMYFSNFKELKLAIKSWNIRRGRPFKFVKNDKTRVKAVCPLRYAKIQCDWEISARNMKKDGTVQIRGLKLKHKCGFKYNNKAVKSGWVASKYTDLLRENPRLDAKSFRAQVMKENKFFVSTDQGYKARRKALKLAQGSEEDQYSLLPGYIAEIQRSNPGSTVVMKMVEGFRDRITGQCRFERIYICFAGVKAGFLSGCRKLLFFDGTFLKGSCGGVLLTAVGIDPNNGFYPIAYTATEGENGSAWCWFLSILRDDLGIEKSEEWTLMSDKQKGLIQACELVFSRSTHRFCVKHLHSNWSSAGFKGFALRKALWAAAKASTPAQFRAKMQKLADIDYEAAMWLAERPSSEWCRAFFKVDPKCDVLLNNHSESFNGKILEHREQPIISMLEGIRLYIMQRMQENRDRARKAWSNKAVCPRIFKIVEKNSEKATFCVPHKSNDENVEVWGDNGDKFAVNVKDRTCTCRRWDLTGIPCVHGVSAIWALNEEPMEYVHELYSVEKYLQCYDHCILPLAGKSEWEQAKQSVPIPPLYGRAPGRPKKSRRRSEVEVVETKEKRQRMKRAGLKGRCTLCGTEGHNRRTCKDKGMVESDAVHDVHRDDNSESIGLENIDEEMLPTHTQESRPSKLPVSFLYIINLLTSS